MVQHTATHCNTLQHTHTHTHCANSLAFDLSLSVLSPSPPNAFSLPISSSLRLRKYTNHCISLPHSLFPPPYLSQIASTQAISLPSLTPLFSLHLSPTQQVHESFPCLRSLDVSLSLSHTHRVCTPFYFPLTLPLSPATSLSHSKYASHFISGGAEVDPVAARNQVFFPLNPDATHCLLNPDATHCLFRVDKCTRREREREINRHTHTHTTHRFTQSLPCTHTYTSMHPVTLDTLSHTLIHSHTLSHTG